MTWDLGMILTGVLAGKNDGYPLTAGYCGLYLAQGLRGNVL